MIQKELVISDRFRMLMLVFWSKDSGNRPVILQFFFFFFEYFQLVYHCWLLTTAMVERSARMVNYEVVSILQLYYELFCWHLRLKYESDCLDQSFQSFQIFMIFLEYPWRYDPFYRISWWKIALTFVSVLALRDTYFFGSNICVVPNHFLMQV